ncbi:ABC transporter ATP-binding protein [uncultured Paenalcaligenes sp.]|uniref:ABC transporter ATP-binding protein n=1 Tax=uncultured Paenalcaligenes sp. TaxID=1588925 RepID=UPI00260754A1|nr:ABC transporter ATP-binding protein [uncultured Paenalcaligenes sp.]
MLKVVDLCVQIQGSGQRVVDQISFTIAKGQTFALVGESGSGKSMTALAMLRLLPEAAQIEGGQVLLGQTDLFSLTESQMRGIRGGKIAMIFQEPATCLNPVLSIGDQLIESLKAHTTYRGAQLKQRAIWWLDRVGISQAATRFDDYPFQFSGGQRQRIMIAMALASEPDLLIADEPTTALDVTVQAQILQLLTDIQQELGLTVLLITHDLAVVQQVADTVALMRFGKIVEIASNVDFFARPQHDYAQQLLAAIPSFAQRQMRLGSQTASLTDPTPVLSVQNLHIAYKKPAGFFRRSQSIEIIKGVSFSLAAGETLALLGASGCGKSTIAKSLLRLLDDQVMVRGQAQLLGDDLLSSRGSILKRQRQDLQIVFQDPFASLNPRMMVGDILTEGLISLQPDLTAQQRQKRIAELLDLTALPKGSAQRYAHEFSGGQRQRIAIARALAVQPKVLICDEPTSALDVSVQAQILDLLIDLQQQTGLAYLFITHNFSVVEYIADRVAIMDAGLIVEQGDAQQVLLQPRHPVSQQLLQSVPRLQTPSSVVS